MPVKSVLTKKGHRGRYHKSFGTRFVAMPAGNNFSATCYLAFRSYVNLFDVSKPQTTLSSTADMKLKVSDAGSVSFFVHWAVVAVMAKGNTQ